MAIIAATFASCTGTKQAANGQPYLDTLVVKFVYPTGSSVAEIAVAGHRSPIKAFKSKKRATRLAHKKVLAEWLNNGIPSHLVDTAVYKPTRTTNNPSEYPWQLGVKQWGGMLWEVPADVEGQWINPASITITTEPHYVTGSSPVIEFSHPMEDYFWQEVDPVKIAGFPVQKVSYANSWGMQAPGMYMIDHPDYGWMFCTIARYEKKGEPKIRLWQPESPENWDEVLHFDDLHWLTGSFDIYKIDD